MPTQVLKRIDESLRSREVREVDAWTAIIIHHASVQGVEGALTEASRKTFMRELVINGETNGAAVGALSLLSNVRLSDAFDYAALAILTASVMERCLRASRGNDVSGGFTIAKGDTDFASTWVQSIEKRHQLDHRSQTAADLELFFDLSNLERLCCLQMQGRGSTATSLVNPITLGDVQSSLGVRHEVPSAQVYRHIEPELVKSYARFLRGRGNSFSLVVVDTKSRAHTSAPRTR